MNNSNDSEQWRIRGIGMDRVPCLLTGLPAAADGWAYRPNISGFVNSKEAGERLVELFGGSDFARLDYRKSEPNWIQVKVGVDRRFEDKGIEVLKRLVELVEANENQISKEIVDKVREEYAELAATPLKPVSIPEGMDLGNTAPK